MLRNSCGTPDFTYEVTSDEVVTSGGITLTCKRIDDRTLERPDVARLALRNDAWQQRAARGALPEG